MKEKWTAREREKGHAYMETLRMIQEYRGEVNIELKTEAETLKKRN